MNRRDLFKALAAVPVAMVAAKAKPDIQIDGARPWPPPTHFLDGPERITLQIDGRTLAEVLVKHVRTQGLT